MANFTRREWLGGAGAAMLAAGTARPGSQAKPAERHAKGKMPLDLSEFQPKSMLRVPETKVARSRYPVIDIHTHISDAEPAALLQVMDRKNLRMLVNVTGGFGEELAETVRKFQTPHPDRFAVFTEPWWERSNEPGYPQFQADQIERAHRAGARGLKILKTLGLRLREQISQGPLVKVDDPRFDPMWEVCGALKMPVAIHTSDPDAFFLPIDRFNERFEELNNHPDWSFYDQDFPSKKELLEARNRVFARHPKTQFVGLHVGNKAENLAYVSECMDRLPNMHVELAARVGELGRQPRTAAKFFDKYQDRILFGTDAVPPPYGLATPQQVFGDELYQIYFRFLETEDEYFDYAPAPVPPQGRWRIYGVGLPDPILRKVYYENAQRLLGLSP
jgi:predicted TIM-barrel fold metal-dependent hydrolase